MLSKLKLFEKTHAQQYLISLHIGVDAGAYILQDNISQLDLLQACRINMDVAARGDDFYRPARRDLQGVGQVLGYTDVGGNGIQHKYNCLAIVLAICNIMAEAVSL